MLRGARVPEEVPHLGGEWVRDGDRYVQGDAQIVWGGMWMIMHLEMPLVYAVAFSEAQHPNTVLPGEWVARVTLPEDWRVLSDFHFKAVGDVFTLDDLGRDYFVRVPQKQPVWFVHPHDNTLVHSGKYGKRYCSYCDKLSSANNFAHQHLPSCLRIISSHPPLWH